MPGRIYPQVGQTITFSGGTDPISGDNLLISVSDMVNGTNGCAPDSGNGYDYDDCPRVQIDLNGPLGAGLLGLPNLTEVNLDADPEPELFTTSDGAVVNQFTNNDGSPGLEWHINGTGAQLNNALQTLQFIPTPGFEEDESADGSLPYIHILAVQGDGVDSTSRDTYIKVEGVNDGPTIGVPVAAIDAPAGGSITTAEGDVTVVDPEMCNETLCGLPYTDPGLAEGDDEMLLVAWLAESSCGTFSLRGGAFPNTGENDTTVLDFLTATAGYSLDQAVAILAPMPTALALDISAQTGGPLNSQTVFVGTGEIDEVRYALSQITFNAPSDDATCNMNIAVSDLGNNGMPQSFVGSAIGQPEAPNPGYEVPDAKSDIQSITFNVSDLKPDVTITQITPGPLGDPAGPNKPSGFRISFSEPVEGFDVTDLSLSTSSATSPGFGLFTPISASEYTVLVTATGDGTLTLTMPGVAYAVGHDGDADYANDPPTYDDNEIEWDQTAPSVGVGLMPGQSDPTADSPILFRVQIGENLTSAAVDLSNTDIVLGGTAGASAVIITQPDVLDDTVFQAAVSGMTQDGTVTVQVKADAIFDTALNGNLASGTYGVDYTAPDTTQPTVTMNRGASQPATTSVSPIVYDVVFSEPVTGFDGNDIDFSASTVGGTLVANIIPISSTDYTVEISGMTTSGDVVPTVKSGAAQDASMNGNEPSTFTVNLVNWVQVVDSTPPTVTINQAVAQDDPTNASPINFTVTFSEPVSGFDGSDIDFTGSTTGGSLSATVTGGASVYNVAVSGMAGSGDVVASVNASAAQDAAGNPSAASTFTDHTVTYDVTAPTVSVAAAAGQSDPTSTDPIEFEVTFSEDVSGFDSPADIVVSGTAGATTGVISGGPAVYLVTVSGMTQTGTVTVDVASGAAADAAGNTNSLSVSADNSVQYNEPAVDNVPPTVQIVQAGGQLDPTSASPILFTATFSESVTGFQTGDVTIGGTAGATTATVTGGPAVYTVSVSGMTQSGTVVVSIGAGVAVDGAANPNLASSGGDNSVTWNQPPVDSVPPTVTINQAGSQADPTSASPIAFTVVFSEPVSGFTDSDVTLGGTAGATTASVSGGPATYTVSVSGMTQSGTVTATINANVATDAANNQNTAATFSDNSVQFNLPVGDNTPPSVTVNKAAAQADPTSGPAIVFDVVFSEPVTGFATNDVVLTGTSGATDVVVAGSGANYTVTVSGMTATGTVTVAIAAGAATDAAANNSLASTAIDDTVQFNLPVGDVTPPSVTINQAAGQADPTSASPIVFTVVFSEPVAGFATGDVTLTGTAGATTAMVSGSGTTYTVSVAGMSQNGTVTASIAAGVAFDAALNGNLASTFTDSTVTYTYTLAVNTTGGPVSVSATGGQLTTFTSTTPNPPVPSNFTAPYGALSFSATTTPGGFVTFTLTLPAPVVDYLKLAGSTWVTFTWDGSTGAQFNGNTVTVTIQDNGRGDSDPTPGVATDPGVPVVRAARIPATGSQSEAPLEWATFFVLLGASLWLATRPRRRPA